MLTAVAPATATSLSSSRMNRGRSPPSCPALPLPVAAPPDLTPPRGPAPAQDSSVSKISHSEKNEPSSSLQNGTSAPIVVVKKESPPSPSLHTRHRPRKLDLSTSLPTSNGLSARAPGGPMTARDGVNMQEVGLACLSPGFQTYDPVMREQLQRSLSVRNHQRSIIESRLQKSARGDGSDGVNSSESNTFTFPKTGSSKRRPPGLSIVPPSAAQFTNERIVQSAPLNQTFTGRHEPQPARYVANKSPTMRSTSYIHHVPATQTNNRLPPLSDVFGSDTLGPRDHDNGRPSYYHTSSTANSSQVSKLPLPSPRMSGSTAPAPAPAPARPREYRSAEEAVQELSGGREELMPRIVHYNSYQRTSSSPHTTKGLPVGTHYDGIHTVVSTPSQPILNPTDSSGRRRPRSEYEHDHGSPPLGHGPEARFRAKPTMEFGAGSAYSGPFAEGRNSSETQRKKKEEFLSLCSRAWDLFHS